MMYLFTFVDELCVTLRVALCDHTLLWVIKDSSGEAITPIRRLHLLLSRAKMMVASHKMAPLY